MADVERAWESMDLPDWANELIELMVSGGKWPEGSETQLWELADKWIAVGDQLGGDVSDLTGAANTLLAGWDAPAAENFRVLGEQIIWQGDMSALPSIAQNAGQVSQQLIDFGRSVQYTKYSINIAFYIAVIELFALVIAAFFTFGTAVAAAGPVQIGLRAAINKAIQELIKKALQRMALRGVSKATVKEISVAAVKNITVKGLAREAVEEMAEELTIDIVSQAQQMGQTTPGGQPVAPNWDFQSTFAAGIGGAVGGIAGGLAAPLTGPIGALPVVGGPMRNMATNMIASPAGGLASLMYQNAANGRPLLEGASELFSSDAMLGNALSALGRPSSHSAFDLSSDGMIANVFTKGGEFTTAWANELGLGITTTAPSSANPNTTTNTANANANANATNTSSAAAPSTGTGTSSANSGSSSPGTSSPGATPAADSSPAPGTSAPSAGDTSSAPAAADSAPGTSSPAGASSSEAGGASSPSASENSSAPTQSQATPAPAGATEGSETSAPSGAESNAPTQSAGSESTAPGTNTGTESTVTNSNPGAESTAPSVQTAGPDAATGSETAAPNTETNASQSPAPQSTPSTSEVSGANDATASDATASKPNTATTSPTSDATAPSDPTHVTSAQNGDAVDTATGGDPGATTSTPQDSATETTPATTDSSGGPVTTETDSTIDEAPPVTTAPTGGEGRNPAPSSVQPGSTAQEASDADTTSGAPDVSRDASPQTQAPPQSQTQTTNDTDAAPDTATRRDGATDQTPAVTITTEPVDGSDLASPTNLSLATNTITDSALDADMDGGLGMTGPAPAAPASPTPAAAASPTTSSTPQNPAASTQARPAPGNPQQATSQADTAASDTETADNNTDPGAAPDVKSTADSDSDPVTTGIVEATDPAVTNTPTPAGAPSPAVEVTTSSTDGDVTPSAVPGLESRADSGTDTSPPNVAAHGPTDTTIEIRTGKFSDDPAGLPGHDTVSDFDGPSDPGSTPPPNGEDPYIHAVESATHDVQSAINSHSDGVDFDQLIKDNFPSDRHAQAATIAALVPAIDAARSALTGPTDSRSDVGAQAIIDRFLGITPDPANPGAQPKFSTGKWIASRTQLQAVVNQFAQATGTPLALSPSPDGVRVPKNRDLQTRKDLHQAISALSSTDKAALAQTMIESARDLDAAKGDHQLNRLRVALRAEGLQLMADQANANLAAAGLDSPGRWAAVPNEIGGESRPSTRYETEVTGSPKGIAYVVTNVDGSASADFDGVRLGDDGRALLLDAKGNYQNLTVEAEPGLAAEARRQIQAADGHPIAWISQYGGPQLVALQTIVSQELAAFTAPGAPALTHGTPTFEVLHEATRRTPPGGTGTPVSPGGPSNPSTPSGTDPGDSGDARPAASPDSEPRTPSVLRPSKGNTDATAPSVDDAARGNDLVPANTPPGGDPPQGDAPRRGDEGHPASDLRVAQVMDIPGTSFHGDAAVDIHAGESRIARNTQRLDRAVTNAMAETLVDSDRSRLADAAGFETLTSEDGHVYSATTSDGNAVTITVDIGVTPTTSSGDRPLVHIQRTDSNPPGSTLPPAYTVTVSDSSLAEHAGQALANALSQVSALTDGHSTRESVLNSRVTVQERIFARDLSVSDLGKVGTIRYLQHSIDATHGKHKLQDMHIRHLANVLEDAGLLLTRSDIATISAAGPGNHLAPPAIERLMVLPKDVHHAVLLANTDHNSRAIDSGMASKSTFVIRGLLQHGFAGIASGATIAAVAGFSPSSVVRATAIAAGRIVGGLAQAKGEFIQAAYKAWVNAHSQANSLVSGTAVQQGARSVLADAQRQLAKIENRERHSDGADVAGKPRPKSTKVPPWHLTAARHSSAGLTTELANFASFEAAKIVGSSLAQTLMQSVYSTPAGAVSAVSSFFGEHHLLKANDKQGSDRKLADDAVDQHVAGAIRDTLDLAAVKHQVALEARAATIDALVERARGGETISAETIASEVPPAPSFDQTLAEVSEEIRAHFAIDPDAEAELVALVEAAENAENLLTRVRKTPTPQRIALEAKLQELGMALPGSVIEPDASLPQAEQDRLQRNDRAWVHKWTGLQTEGLSHRLAAMTIRPTAVASWADHVIKGTFAGGVGAGMTVGTTATLTGLSPEEIAILSGFSAVSTGLIAGTSEHAVQVAAENLAQRQKPTEVLQSKRTLELYADGIEATIAVADAIEASQQREIDQLLGRSSGEDADVTRGDRAAGALDTLLNTFGQPSSSKPYVGGVNHYGSRIFAKDAWSSALYAVLNGNLTNLPAALSAAISSHFGEGLVKHTAQQHEVTRKREIGLVQNEYQRAQLARAVAVDSGEHLGHGPDRSVAPPPITESPFATPTSDSDADAATRRHIEGPVPTIHTMTSGDVTITVDLANNQATVVDHLTAEQRQAQRDEATRQRPIDHTTDPNHLHLDTTEHTHTTTHDNRTITIDLDNNQATVTDHLTPAQRQAQRDETTREEQPNPPATPPADEPPHRDRDTQRDDPPRRPYRLINIVRGAQWREPWWREVELRPITPPCELPPPEQCGPDETTPPAPCEPEPTTPPTSPTNPTPPGTSQPSGPQSPSSPGGPSGPGGQTTGGPDGDDGGATDPSSETEDGALTVEPAGDDAVDVAIAAAEEAARLLGMQLVQLRDGSFALRDLDGELLRLDFEAFFAEPGDTLMVERDGDFITVKVNEAATAVDIALEVVAGLTAAGRLAIDTSLEPITFGDDAPPPEDAEFSVADHVHMARLEMLLSYLEQADTPTDLEALRSLLRHELTQMGLAEPNRWADELAARLPDELRGSLLQVTELPLPESTTEDLNDTPAGEATFDDEWTSDDD